MSKLGWLLKTVYSIVMLVVNTFIWASLTVILSFTPWSRFGGNFCSRWWSRLNLILNGVKVVKTGFEKVDTARNYMIMCNHRSFTDVYTVFGYSGLTARPVVKKEFMKIPIFGMSLRRADSIVVDRSDRESAVAEMNRVGAKLRKLNLSVAIYAEGTRQEKILLAPFKKGGFMLALSLGLPILPTCVWGTDKLQHKGELIIRSGVIRFHACDVIETTGYTPETVGLLIDKVHAVMLAEIERLTKEIA